VITNNAGGGIKLQDPGPQGKVCGNRMKTRRYRGRRRG